MNPYQKFVADGVRLVQDARAFPLGGFPPAPRPQLAPDAAKALFFAPHPDDETIVGALALRIFREAKMNLINVAVTQGSKRERQAERLVELQNACNYLGYDVQTTGPHGLEKVTMKTRQNEPQLWADMVPVITDILIKHQPRVILFPHERDWNGTHIGVHHLVMDALKQMPSAFECYLVETEFWGTLRGRSLSKCSPRSDCSLSISCDFSARGTRDENKARVASSGLKYHERRAIIFNPTLCNSKSS